MAYSHSGAPGHIEVQQDLLERAWPREDMLAAGPGSGWDAERLGQVLPPAIERWVEFWVEGDPAQQDVVRRGKERTLEEAAGMIRDIFQELETRDASDAQLEDDEAETVGQSLLKLASYVLHLRYGLHSWVMSVFLIDCAETRMALRSYCPNRTPPWLPTSCCATLLHF